MKAKYYYAFLKYGDQLTSVILHNHRITDNSFPVYSGMGFASLWDAMAWGKQERERLETKEGFSVDDTNLIIRD